MAPMQWITNGEVGISSRTIWAVMVGAITGRESWTQFGTPWDADDLRRCVLLVDLFPDFRERLHEVGERFPEWIPLIREWERLERMYRGIRTRGDADESDDWSRIYKEITQEMQPLLDEGKTLAGWTRTGPSSWRRGATAAAQ